MLSLSLFLLMHMCSWGMNSGLGHGHGGVLIGGGQLFFITLLIANHLICGFCRLALSTGLYHYPFNIALALSNAWFILSMVFVIMPFGLWTASSTLASLILKVTVIFYFCIVCLFFDLFRLRDPELV